MKQQSATTTYTAHAITGQYYDQFFPLTAKTDATASKQTAKIAASMPQARVYCEFDRSEDGQHGYINRNGAALTGIAY